MCSRNYAEWRERWWFGAKADNPSVAELIGECVPITLSGHPADIGVYSVIAVLLSHLYFINNGHTLSNESHTMSLCRHCCVAVGIFIYVYFILFQYYCYIK